MIIDYWLLLPYVKCPACGWEHRSVEVARWRKGLRCMNGEKPDCDALLEYHVEEEE